MQFTPIDLQHWNRREHFYYFSKMAPTGWSVTVQADITHLRQILKNHDLKFYPTYLWLVTKNLNRQIEMKIAEQDGLIGYFDTLTPLYAVFHDDDHTFSLMYTEFSDSFSDFYNACLKNQAEYGQNHGILCQPSPPPANAYTVSCMPWVHFSHFAVHTYENKPYYFPSVEAGKFTQEQEKWILPLSLTFHHATTDGFHLQLFLQDFQSDCDSFEQYI